MFLTDLGQLAADCAAARHGDYAAYRKGCRCPHAREAERIYKKRLRYGRAPQRYVSAVGTRRRLQALAALGWRWQDLAEPLGVTWQAIQHLAIRARTGTVHVVTVERVKRLYAERSLTPGPSAITRRRTLAKGWAPPFAWDDALIDDPDAQPNLGDPDAEVIDWLVVEKALRGERVEMARVDKHAAVHQGLARGIGATRLVLLLRLGMRTIRALEATPLPNGEDIAA